MFQQLSSLKSVPQQIFMKTSLWFVGFWA